MNLSSCWTAATSLALLLCPSADGIAQSDSTAPENPLHQLAFLEGSWAGTIQGTIGSATGQRRYRLIIRDRFLLMLHDRDPEGPTPPADAHEEWSIFSYDAERKAITVREFLVEGIVNTYACVVDVGPTSLTCESEATEGGPEMVLKLRYEFAGRDRFTELFEIFGPAGALRVRMEGQWQRISEGGTH